MQLFTIKSVDCAIVKLSSGKTTISILQVDLISCRYFENTLYVRSCQHISYKCENVRHFAVWLKLFVACSDGPKNFWFLLAIKQQIYAQNCKFMQNYKLRASVISMEFSIVNCRHPSHKTLLGLLHTSTKCNLAIVSNIAHNAVHAMCQVSSLKVFDYVNRQLSAHV